MSYLSAMLPSYGTSDELITIYRYFLIEENNFMTPYHIVDNRFSTSFQFTEHSNIIKMFYRIILPEHELYGGSSCPNTYMTFAIFFSRSKRKITILLKIEFQSLISNLYVEKATNIRA